MADDGKQLPPLRLVATSRCQARGCSFGRASEMRVYRGNCGKRCWGYCRDGKGRVATVYVCARWDVAAVVIGEMQSSEPIFGRGVGQQPLLLPCVARYGVVVAEGLSPPLTGAKVDWAIG